MSTRAFARLSVGVLAYNLAVILWGAYVRATGSGAGCGSHWPTCNGRVIPQSPTVHTLIEFTHRASSGIALISVVALLVCACLAHPKGHPARRASGYAMLFMLTEALLGAGLVLFGLVDKNNSVSRVVAMSLHLVNTFALLAALGRTVQTALAPDIGELRVKGQDSGGVVTGLGLVLLPLLAITGAIAALGDTLFPARSLLDGLSLDLDPAAHFLLRLRALHPLLAVGTGAYVALGAAFVAQVRPRPAVRNAAYAVGILFLLQLLAGGANLLLLAPVWMQMVHLLLADGVWLAWVWLAGAVWSTPLAQTAAAAADVDAAMDAPVRAS